MAKNLQQVYFGVATTYSLDGNFWLLCAYIK